MPKKTNTKINNSKYFRVTATVGKDADGLPIRKAFYGSSKKEAEQKKDEYLRNINGGLSAGYEKLTFEVAYLQWFEMIHKPTLALASVKRYESDNKRILLSLLVPMRLVDIKAIHVQRFCTDCLEAGASINTIRNMCKLLSPFFTYAVKTDLITKNPMLAVELPKERKIEKEKRILSNDEVQKIIVHSRDNGSAFIFVFLAFTGLRQGEALALTHNDVNFTNNSITVNKSINHLMHEGKYQAVLSTTKTTGSTRLVPLLGELKPLLLVHIRAEKEKCLRLSIPFSGDNILFSSETGGYIEGKNLRTRFKRLLNRLDIEQVTVHALRHGFCSTLAKNGANLKAASEIMGHSDINTTLKIYTHVQDEEKKNAVDSLSDMFKLH